MFEAKGKVWAKALRREHLEVKGSDLRSTWKRHYKEKSVTIKLEEKEVGTRFYKVLYQLLRTSNFISSIMGSC